MNVIHTILRKSLSTITYSWKSLFPTKGIPVLMYHRINDDHPPGNLDVPIKNFEEQMNYLANKGYSTLSIEKFYAILLTTRYERYKDKIILLTFDDGWKDNYTNAFPILKKNSFTATIFIICNTVENKHKYPEYLSKNEIFKMQQYGIEFGSHTFNHKELPTLNEQGAKNEIVISKIYLEKLLSQ
nr:polysaccharide deacetylase family protein [Bacteroidota bacterium]